MNAQTMPVPDEQVSRMQDRIDHELLAQLLWDFFGPHEPRHFLHDGPNHGIPSASERGVATYRQCAKDIADSLISAMTEREARLESALSHYAAEYCEGWCEGSPCGVFEDCGGCIARVTLQETR